MSEAEGNVLCFVEDLFSQAGVFSAKGLVEGLSGMSDTLRENSAKRSAPMRLTQFSQSSGTTSGRAPGTLPEAFGEVLRTS